DASELSVVIGEQRLVLPPSVLADRPTLVGYVGRTVVVGIRAEAMDDAELARSDEGPIGTLQAEVERREALGAELLIHASVTGRPVVTEDVKQIAADSDDAVVDALERQAAAGRAVLVARFDPRSSARAGDRITLAVNTEQLHIFDLETGLAVRGEG